MQTIHIYGQKPTQVKTPFTVQDLRSIASFNRIIKNYLKMQRIESQNSQLLPAKEREHAASPTGLSKQLRLISPSEGA